MRATALAFSLSLFVPTCVAGDAPKDKPAGVKELAGEWRLVSTADQKRRDAGSDSIRMVVEENGHVRFLFGGTETNSGAFTAVEGKAKPRSIDLKMASGKVYRGVYALKNGTLRLCFDEVGKSRPAALKPTGTQWLERWQRAGKGAGPARCGQSTTEPCGEEEVVKTPGGGNV
jgi:uncharacterized protein (TIGR03067 family)